MDACKSMKGSARAPTLGESEPCPRLREPNWAGTAALGPFLILQGTDTYASGRAGGQTHTDEQKDRVILVSSFAAEIKVSAWACGVEFSGWFKDNGILGVPASAGDPRSDLFVRQS
ncbi:hypothetical protein F4809DRAFT_644779 [Biscogniauxia mediterranea]|nr:hypothetical protein F4809DRAFT_644779 [Biscogniauxia mediterranea]